MSLVELQELGALIRQMEDSLHRVARERAGRRESTSVVAAEIRRLKESAIQVGMATRLRAQAEHASELVSQGTGLPTWWPWAAVGGGAVLLWWFTKKGK
jgi:hypothetical protein